MASAVSIPSSTLVAEFLTEKGKEVIKKMFLSPETANMVRKFDGVTDKLILAEQDITTSLIKEWSSTLSWTDDALVIKEVKLETAQLKTELKFILREETTRAYKAYLKGAGITADDMSLVEYLLEQPMEKQAEEIENAMWQAVTIAPSGTPRTLTQRIDGYRKIAKDAGVAGNATVVTTGAITSSNAVSKVESFYRACHKEMKKKGLVIYCSYTLFEDYQQNMLTLHPNSDVNLVNITGTGYTLTGLKLRLGGGKSMLVPVAGFGDDDALVGTRPEFLAYGFDYESESSEWDIQKQGWETWALNAFPMGLQILLKKPGFLLVNDRL